MFSLKNLLLFAVLVTAILMLKYKDEVEKFGTDYFHHAKMQETSDYIDERIKQRKKLEGQPLEDKFFTVEQFESNLNPGVPVYGEEDQGYGDLNKNVISVYPSSMTKPSERKVVDYSYPGLHDFSSSSLADFDDTKRSQERKDFEKVRQAFKEAQGETFYKAIELYKMRGGNRRV